MKKFSDYAQKNEKTNSYKGEDIRSNESAFELLKRVASKYEGASESDLITAILSEAKKSRERGNLSNAEIDNFANTISPMLNDKQRKRLFAVIESIKRGEWRYANSR